MKLRDLFVRRHPRHPAGRVLPRADPEPSSPPRSASTSSPAASRGTTRSASGCPRHPRAVRAPAHGISASWTSRAAPSCRRRGSPASTARASRASPSCWASRSTASRCPSGRSLAEACSPATPRPRRAARRVERCAAQGRPDRGGVRHRRRRPRQRAHPHRRRAQAAGAPRLLHRSPRRRLRAQARARRPLGSFEQAARPPWAGRGPRSAGRMADDDFSRSWRRCSPTSTPTR
jgi:hypothetical protein